MIHKSGNFWFFLILSSNFWLAPLLPTDVANDVFTETLIAVTLLAAVILQAFARPRFWGLAVAVGLVIVAAVIAEELWPETLYIENGVFAVSFAAVTGFYFHTMLETLEDVTFDTVLAAACAYILIGMVFACIFALIVEQDPMAFAPEGAAEGYRDFIYYSFSTLTTLGDSDVTPMTDAAKLMTVFEAMVGLIYVAILVGAVVGAFSAKLGKRD